MILGFNINVKIIFRSDYFIESIEIFLDLLVT